MNLSPEQEYPQSVGQLMPDNVGANRFVKGKEKGQVRSKSYKKKNDGFVEVTGVGYLPDSGIGRCKTARQNKKSGENIHAFSNRRQLLPAPERASWVAHPIGMISLSRFSVSS
jgi:hypothetical protein